MRQILCIDVTDLVGNEQLCVQFGGRVNGNVEIPRQDTV